MGDYPALIICHELAPIYKKFSNWGLIINIVNNVADLRDFLAKYTNVKSDIPVILSDIARIGMFQSRLLKFVEENQSPLIIVSSRDCVTRVLLSRFKRVIKYPKVIKNERDRPDFLMDRIVEGESIPTEDIVRNAPSAYHVMEIMSKCNLSSRDKIKQVLFNV